MDHFIVQRLKPLAPLIGATLISGIHSRIASAECTTDPHWMYRVATSEETMGHWASSTICVGATDSLVGDGPNTPEGAMVSLKAGAQIVTRDTSAISVGNAAIITLDTNALVQNAASSELTPRSWTV